MKCCEQIDVEALPHGQVEVELAHNVLDDTARTLAGTAGAKSLDVAQEQYSRADCISRRGGAPFVVDYKCGDLKDKNPTTSNQLLGIAAAVRGVERSFAVWPSAARVEAHYLGFAGIRSNGSVDWVVSKVSDADLDRFVMRARQVHLRVIEDRKMVDLGQAPDFVRGPECRWCELRHTCPAWK